MNSKTAVILANVGTPDEPSVGAVRKYLFQFLNDKRVIDLPWLARKILVNLIIVPFRTPKSTQLYRKLWTPKGSPLLTISNESRDKLQEVLGNNYEVFVGMRYQNPSLKKVLRYIKSQHFDKLIILPLFPQYASSTVGTISELINKEVATWNVTPELHIITQFYQNPGFINSFAEQINKYDPAKYDHLIFSYHGLPLRQTDKVHPEIKTSECLCENKMPEHGHFCYKATCYETSRLLVKALNLPAKSYSVAFQSRLTKNWLMPFTNKKIIELAKQGNKRILIAAPAFIADCLETKIEIEIEYQQLFQNNGGEKIQLVESLNTNQLWINTLSDLVGSL